MARIPDAVIDRLKREVSLQRLVEARGIALKRYGADLLGLCPFHEDREPSLVVSPKTNLWHCLGACQAGGSVIDWVMKSRGVSFRHAAELLRNEHPSLTVPIERVVKKGATQAVKLPPLFEVDAGDQRVLQDILRYYQDTLKNSPAALKYLQRRGLNHPEMLDRFRLGFSNRTLGYHLPDRNRKEGAEARTRLQKIGLIREPSGHEHFTGSVVFPIFDLEGNVLGLYGRKINDNLRAGTPMHTYLPGPHRGVWNELALQVSKEIILCESIIDALTFWCAGFRNVTASYGVNPYARELTFLDSRTRARRDHTKYLTLIRSIALLHQYQRPVKTIPHRGRTVSYIEVALSDIEIANRLAHEVLGRSLDELPPQTRRLLTIVDDAVTAECRRLKMERCDFRFSRRDVRAWAPWGDTVLKKHLGRLEDMEYLLVHRGGRGQSFVYELVFVRGEDPSRPQLPGLIDVYDLKKAHREEEKSPPGRPQVVGMARAGRVRETPVNTGVNGGLAQNGANTTDTGQAAGGCR